MVAKCANPECTVPFLYLHEGKLFRVDMPSATHPPDSVVNASDRKPVRKVEFFWLCSGCAARMTLNLDEVAGVTVQPRVQARAAGL